MSMVHVAHLVGQQAEELVFAVEEVEHAAVQHDVTARQRERVDHRRIVDDRHGNRVRSTRPERPAGPHIGSWS